MCENDGMRVVVIAGKTSRESLNNGIVNGFLNKSFVKNAEMLFVQSFSTAQFVFDENEGMLGRRILNEGIEIFDGSFGNNPKRKIVKLENGFKILQGDKM